MSSEDQELQEILNNSPNLPVISNKSTSGESPCYANEQAENKNLNVSFSQWTTTDNENYFPAGKTSKKLPPGLYEPKFSYERGPFFSHMPVKTEDLISFPGTNVEKILKEVEKFWTQKSIYNDHNIPYRRGIVMWGSPGTGKTCTISLVIKDLIDRGGIAVKMGDPNTFMQCMRVLRIIHPDMPVVVLMEDIDSLIASYPETDILNILDGVEKIESVLFLATTNYPEQLGPRIMNRPSRFDRRFKMPNLKAEARKIYFEHLLSKSKIDQNIDIDQWVKDTQGMTTSHLKELFVAVCILGEEYKDIIATLNTMCEEKVTSDENSNKIYGFGMTQEED